MTYFIFSIVSTSISAILFFQNLLILALSRGYNKNDPDPNVPKGLKDLKLFIQTNLMIVGLVMRISAFFTFDFPILFGSTEWFQQFLFFDRFNCSVLSYVFRFFFPTFFISYCYYHPVIFFYTLTQYRAIYVIRATSKLVPVFFSIIATFSIGWNFIFYFTNVELIQMTENEYILRPCEISPWVYLSPQLFPLYFSGPLAAFYLFATFKDMPDRTIWGPTWLFFISGFMIVVSMLTGTLALWAYAANASVGGDPFFFQVSSCYLSWNSTALSLFITIHIYISNEQLHKKTCNFYRTIFCMKRNNDVSPVGQQLPSP